MRFMSLTEWFQAVIRQCGIEIHDLKQEVHGVPIMDHKSSLDTPVAMLSKSQSTVGTAHE